MIDDNWELISGEDAHEIEVLNYSNQVNVIEALVRYLTHHFPPDELGCPSAPNENVAKELHRTATLFLLHQPGAYREEVVHVGINGRIIYQPPGPDEVEALMNRFFTDLRERWSGLDIVSVGAYVLWFVNWVHPFKNGNGRTARALAYACVCLKFGGVAPGNPTFPDLVMQNRSDYQHALRIADIAYEANGAPDLAPMEALVERLIMEQLSSVDLDS